MHRAFAALGLVLIVLTAGLSACSSYPTGHHWPGSGDRWIPVRIAADAAGDPNFVAAVQHGAWGWTNASPYVNFDVQVGSCVDPQPCIEIHRQPMNGASTSWSIDGNKHILHGWTYFDINPWDYWTLVNAVCHELGHDLGLTHGSIPGPCSGGAPTDVDLYHIATAYNHAD